MSTQYLCYEFRFKSVFHLKDYVFTAKWNVQLVFEVVINSCADIKQTHFSFIGKFYTVEQCVLTFISTILYI